MTSNRYSVVLQESLQKLWIAKKRKLLTGILKTKIFPQIKQEQKNIALPIIFHMPPWLPVNLLWGLSISSFRAGFFFTVSAQTSLNWFLLILQTAKLSDEKESFCYHQQDFWFQNFTKVATLASSCDFF